MDVLCNVLSPSFPWYWPLVALIFLINFLKITVDSYTAVKNNTDTSLIYSTSPNDDILQNLSISPPRHWHEWGDIPSTVNPWAVPVSWGNRWASQGQQGQSGFPNQATNYSRTPFFGSTCPPRYPSADREVSGPEWKKIFVRNLNSCPGGGVLPLLTDGFLDEIRMSLPFLDGFLLLFWGWEMPGPGTFFS